MLCFFSTQHGGVLLLALFLFLSCSPRGALAFRACTGALMGPSLKALNAIRSYARTRHNKGFGVRMPEGGNGRIHTVHSGSGVRWMAGLSSLVQSDDYPIQSNPIWLIKHIGQLTIIQILLWRGAGRGFEEQEMETDCRGC